MNNVQYKLLYKNKCFNCGKYCKKILLTDLCVKCHDNGLIMQRDMCSVRKIDLLMQPLKLQFTDEEGKIIQTSECTTSSFLEIKYVRE